MSTAPLKSSSTRLPAAVSNTTHLPSELIEGLIAPPAACSGGVIRVLMRSGEEALPVPNQACSLFTVSLNRDADWKGADAIGDEAVGGSVATPDKDVVDEIGEALGVAQDPEAEVTTSEEILRRRDRLRWHLELEADAKERQEEEQG